MTGLIRFNRVPAIRWTPFVATARGAAPFDRAVDAIAAHAFADATATADELRADVTENAGAYILQLDVPGVAKEDITVDVDEKTVRIEANFKREAVEGDSAVLNERASGSLSRSFRLPQAVDAEQAVARHEHGVLTLTLPKKNATTQKRLAIN